LTLAKSFSFTDHLQKESDGNEKEDTLEASHEKQQNSFGVSI